METGIAINATTLRQNTSWINLDNSAIQRYLLGHCLSATFTGHGTVQKGETGFMDVASEPTELIDPQETELLIGVINRFIGLFSRQIQKNTQNETTREYPFVAMDTRQVFQELCIVYRHLALDRGLDPGNLKFLDIGCGFGNVLLMAEQFGFQVYGLEKDGASLEIARQFFQADQLISEDLREFDGYKDFNIIYYFCPLTQGEREFEELLENKMAVGTVLIANYKRSKKINNDRRFRRLSSSLPVWEKIAA